MPIFTPDLPFPGPSNKQDPGVFGRRASEPVLSAVPRVSFKVLSPAYRPCPSYAHASLTSSTWITCPPSPLSSEDFSLVQMLLIFLILRQQNQARCLLAKGFLSMYPPIVYHAFFLRPQHNLRSFYLCRIPLHSTFSSTGCILDVLNTSKTVSTGALFSYLEIARKRCVPGFARYHRQIPSSLGACLEKIPLASFSSL